MDGFSLYAKIQNLEAKVRICFLTAADKAYYEILKKHYSSIKENCVIYKPVDNESLLELLRGNHYKFKYALKRSRKSRSYLSG